MLEFLVNFNSDEKIDESSLAKSRFSLSILTLNINKGDTTNIKVTANEKNVNIGSAGDIMGINIEGTNNTIEKNVNSSKSFNANVINIDDKVLSSLDPQYAHVFNEFAKSLNKYLAESKTPYDSNVILDGLNELVKETTGIKPDQLPNEVKRKEWKAKFILFGRIALKMLPKTVAVLTLFHPLTSQFSGIIEPGLDALLEGIQSAYSE